VSRRWRVAVAAVPLLVAALAGCGVSATDLPIPGGGVEGPSYQLTAVFADALNLPDGIHPNAAGQRMVADTVWRALQPLLRSSRD